MSVLALAIAASLLVACGGKNDPQDKDEPEGNFPVEVVSAKFPADQKLAKTSELVIEVRNAGDEEIPNISVTVENFYYRKDIAPGEEKTGLADPNRPIFVINEIPTRPGGPPRDTERLDPLEQSSAYVDTYPLGKLKANETTTFRWDVTAVRAGPFCVAYRVNAGLDGKAKAVLDNEEPEQTCSKGNTVTQGRPIDQPTGAFAGVVSDEAPDARIAADGETVIKE